MDTSVEILAKFIYNEATYDGIYILSNRDFQINMENIENNLHQRHFNLKHNSLSQEEIDECKRTISVYKRVLELVYINYESEWKLLTSNINKNNSFSLYYLEECKKGIKVYENVLNLLSFYNEAEELEEKKKILNMKMEKWFSTFKNIDAKNMCVDYCNSNCNNKRKCVKRKSTFKNRICKKIFKI